MGACCDSATAENNLSPAAQDSKLSVKQPAKEIKIGSKDIKKEAKKEA